MNAVRQIHTGPFPKLSKKQMECLKAIKKYRAEHDRLPKYKELDELMKVGTGGAAYHIRMLVTKGYLYYLDEHNIKHSLYAVTPKTSILARAARLRELGTGNAADTPSSTDDVSFGSGAVVVNQPAQARAAHTRPQSVLASTDTALLRRARNLLRQISSPTLEICALVMEIDDHLLGGG